jgi:phage anti-repressor protein
MSSKRDVGVARALNGEANLLKTVNLDDFAAWLTTQTNANGSLFLSKIAKLYAHNLISTPPKLDIPLTAEERDVFCCLTINEFDRLCEIFRNAPNYHEINRHANHGAFSAGLRAYRRYLESFAGQVDNIKLSANLHTLPKKPIIPDTVIDILTSDYPNGFVFDTTAIRLISDKSGIDVDDSIQSALKREMFHRNDDVYFLLDTVATAETCREITDFADTLLDNYGCFEVSELYAFFIDHLNERCIDGVENFEALYKFINKRDIRCVTTYGTRIARVQTKSIYDISLDIARKVTVIVHDEYGGAISEDDLRNRFPVFSTTLLANIINKHAEELIITEINGIVCYQTIDTFGLSDEFSNILTETLLQLDDLGLIPSEDVLHTALSIRLGVNFKDEYNIPDDKTYRRLIVTYYRDTPKREWKRGVFTVVQD